MNTPRTLTMLVLAASTLFACGCEDLVADGGGPSASTSSGAPHSRTIADRILGSNSGSTRELAAGTHVEVRLLQDVDSGTASVGDNADAAVVQPVSADGAVVIPAGARVMAKVDAVQSARHFGGKAMVVVRFTSIAVQGTDVEISGSMTSSAQGQKGRDTAIIAGSAAGGAILGKVLGGDDKDAVAGAIVGGGIGTAVASRKGDEALLPAGTTTTVITVGNQTLRSVD